jgi:hypothetical protein
VGYDVFVTFPNTNLEAEFSQRVVRKGCPKGVWLYGTVQFGVRNFSDDQCCKRHLYPADQAMKHLGKKIFRERRPMDNIPKETRMAILTNPEMLESFVQLTRMQLIGVIFYRADPGVLTLIE